MFDDRRFRSIIIKNKILKIHIFVCLNIEHAFWYLCYVPFLYQLCISLKSFVSKMKTRITFLLCDSYIMDSVEITYAE